MKPLNTSLAFLALTGAALSAPPASATPPPPARTTTDCKAKVYVIDDLVCSSPELHALEEQVEILFRAAPDAANPEWPRMVEGQQGWYWRSRQCWKQPAKRQPDCLKAAYHDRSVELSVLAAPPAAGAGRPFRCEGPPWAQGRDVRLNGTAEESLTLSDPSSGQVLAIALPHGARAGWKPFLSPRRKGAGWRFTHENGAAYLVCRPA